MMGRQAILCTNPGVFLIEPLVKNFNEIWIKIQQKSHKNIYLKMSSAK